MSILNVSHLTIRRGDKLILDDVSWRVQPGQHWVILGANGSGKTSLLSAITGYLTPNDGDIELLAETFGQTDWRELRKRVGLVSSSIRQLMAEEEPALETVISGKYAMIDLWLNPTAADRRAARQLLRQVEAEDLADRPWGYLSQGERQRVLIGRALMAKPTLLILDEPCAGLDPVARENFLQFLQRLGRSKNAPTLVLVTHHVEEIVPAFTHILLLRDGKVFASGKKSQALTSLTISGTFANPIRLEKKAGRYTLKMGKGKGGGVI